jgi:hypothetical protein
VGHFPEAAEAFAAYAIQGRRKPGTSAWSRAVGVVFPAATRRVLASSHLSTALASKKTPAAETSRADTRE